MTTPRSFASRSRSLPPAGPAGWAPARRGGAIRTMPRPIEARYRGAPSEPEAAAA